MYLEEIIEDVQLENDKFEAKSILNRDDVVGWLKSIAGFANASGGEFYIGVEDKTNILTNSQSYWWFSIVIYFDYFDQIIYK